MVNFFRKIWDEVDFEALKREASMQEKLEAEHRSKVDAPVFKPVNRRLDVEI